MDVKAAGITGKVAAAALDAAGIVCNKNTIPYDTETPFVTSGIRIGTAAVSTRGMGPDEMRRIGGWIAQVLRAPEDAALAERIRGEVRALAARFPVP